MKFEKCAKKVGFPKSGHNLTANASKIIRNSNWNLKFSCSQFEYSINDQPLDFSWPSLLPGIEV